MPLTEHLEVDHNRYTQLHPFLLDHYAYHNLFFPCIHSVIASLKIGMIEQEIPFPGSMLGQYTFTQEYGFSSESTMKVFYIGISQFAVIPKPDSSETPRHLTNQLLHTDTKNHFLCDTTLKFREGTLSVHACILAHYGGNGIRAMLTNSMQESLKKEIFFPKFSVTTGSAFVDFIYLGLEGLTETSLQEAQVNLCELLDMACMYEMKPLIQFCAYLIGQNASPEDKIWVEQLAELYGNEDLLRLHEHWQTTSHL